VLDVEVDCTEDDVKRKFRRLALRLHPDKVQHMFLPHVTAPSACNVNSSALFLALRIPITGQGSRYPSAKLTCRVRQCDQKGGEEAFMAINLAHETLSDAEKRKKNDYLLTLHQGRFRSGPCSMCYA
jgi:curved DNA-binding protein CbpA